LQALILSKVLFTVLAARLPPEVQEEAGPF